MQIDIDKSQCSYVVEEMKTISKNLRVKIEDLEELYNYYVNKDTDEAYFCSKKTRKIINRLEAELRKITIMTESMVKIISVYEKTENVNCEIFDNIKFAPITEIVNTQIPYSKDIQSLFS